MTIIKRLENTPNQAAIDSSPCPDPAPPSIFCKVSLYRSATDSPCIANQSTAKVYNTLMITAARAKPYPFMWSFLVRHIEIAPTNAGRTGTGISTASTRDMIA